MDEIEAGFGWRGRGITMGRHEEKRTPVIRILLTPGEFGPRLQVLLALAMRPERLSPAELRAIHRELAAVRARAH